MPDVNFPVAPVQTRRAEISNAPDVISTTAGLNPGRETTGSHQRTSANEPAIAKRAAIAAATPRWPCQTSAARAAALRGWPRAVGHIRHRQDRPARRRGSRDIDRYVFGKQSRYFRGALQPPLA